jgi:hypothetical protein
MQIRLTEVGPVKKEGKYFVLPIKYDDKGKEFSRKVMSFVAGDAYKVLKDSKVGEFYNVTIEKDDNGYWQWPKVEKVEGGTVAETKVGTVRSTYETPQERALKQIYIVRQSSIANAITLAGVGENNVENILDIARRLEAWVFRTSPADLVDDKPWENE